MKKLLVLLLGIFLLSSGCITVQSYTKLGVDFSKIKKIAIVKLDSHDPLLSQIVTDHISLGFRKEGFKIIEKERLKVIIDENAVIQSGLTEQDRKTLSLAGIDGVIVGTVRARNYYKGSIGATKKLAIGTSREDEKLQVTVKMFDIENNDVVWSANIHELDPRDLDEIGEGLAKSVKIKKRIAE